MSDRKGSKGRGGFGGEAPQGAVLGLDHLLARIVDEAERSERGRRGQLAVAIATRDRPDALARCLASLAHGVRRPREVVVVDQGRDGTARDVVLAADAASPFPCRWLPQPPRGLGAAQNAAIAATTSPLVAVLDDDCVADDGWLAVLEATLDGADDAPDVVAGRVLPLPPAGERRCAVASRLSTEPRELAGPAPPWLLGSGNNFALRRAWFDRVGGCDERLGPGAPARGGVDMDLFRRLLRAGARGRYEPAAVVLHERRTRAERRARRPMYGRGMGAAIALWLRDGDPAALRILGRWIALRSGALGRAARRQDFATAWEEMVMLASTVTGLAHGAWLGRRPRRGDPVTAG